jgi:hypothetical protein
VLALGACVPAVAAGAPHNTVAVSGPSRVSPKHAVQLDITGYATAGVTTLAVWLDARTCAPTARSEEGRPHLPQPARFQVAAGFTVHLTIKRSVPGRHFACAYLVRPSNDRTVARGSWRYVTRRR